MPVKGKEKLGVTDLSARGQEEQEQYLWGPL